jgi:hypothetical protein
MVVTYFRVTFQTSFFVDVKRTLQAVGSDTTRTGIRDILGFLRTLSVAEVI